MLKTWFKGLGVFCLVFGVLGILAGAFMGLSLFLESLSTSGLIVAMVILFSILIYFIGKDA